MRFQCRGTIGEEALRIPPRRRQERDSAEGQHPAFTRAQCRSVTGAANAAETARTGHWTTACSGFATLQPTLAELHTRSLKASYGRLVCAPKRCYLIGLPRPQLDTHSFLCVVTSNGVQIGNGRSYRRTYECSMPVDADVKKAHRICATSHPLPADGVRSSPGMPPSFTTWTNVPICLCRD